MTFPQPGGLTGGCDLVHYRDAGAVGIVLGPGSLDVAHQPDEYVPTDDLVRAAMIYSDIAVAMMRSWRCPAASSLRIGSAELPRSRP